MGKAISLLRKGGELIRQREWEKAVDVYLRATETDATDSRCWLGLGVCLLKVGNLGMARIAMQNAQRLGHPKAPKAFSHLEEAERRAGSRPQEAQAAAAPAKAAQPTARGEAADSVYVMRPAVRPGGEKIDLGREIPIMLVEPIELHRQAIIEAIEQTIEGAEVSPVPYTVSCADTLSRRVQYYVAVLDWDADPRAASGLIQILKIKRPEMLVICLTESWNPAQSARILRSGADYHLVKSAQFASTLPLIIAQWVRRDKAVFEEHEALYAHRRDSRWPDCLNALGKIMILVDPDYTILQANRAAVKALAKDDGGLVGRQYSAMLYGTEEPPESCPLLKVLQLDRAASGRIHHARTGKTFDVQVWPVLSRGGKTSSAIALLGEKAAEEATGVEKLGGAADLAAVLSEAADRLQCGMVALDGQGRITWLNAPAAELLCGDKDSLLGREYLDMLSNSLQDFSAAPQSFIEAVISAHRSGRSLEDCPLHATPSEEGATLRYWSTPVPGGPPGVRRVEHYYPAAERVSPQAPIHADAQHVVRLVEALGGMLFRTDAEGKVTWSISASRVAGRDDEKLRGNALSELAAPEDRRKVRDLLRQALASDDGAWKEEIVLTCADGTRRCAELTLMPLGKGQEGDKGVEGVLRDVTDKRMTEAIRAILAGQDDA